MDGKRFVLVLDNGNILYVDDVEELVEKVVRYGVERILVVEAEIDVTRKVTEAVKEILHTVNRYNIAGEARRAILKAFVESLFGVRL